MRMLTLVIAFLLIAIGFGQTTAPPFTVANRITATTSPAAFRNQILKGKLLYGVNVTDGACAPSDPVAAAKLLRSYGVNWVRLHHIDRGLKEGWWTTAQVLKFMDAGQAEGIRFSIDGMSKIGEIYPTGVDGFKKDLMSGNPTAEQLYRDNVGRITPLLKHPAMFMACLTNECAHLTTPANGLTFWNKWSPLFRGINPNLLLTDMSDSWQTANTTDWDVVTKNYDAVTAHFYGTQEDFATGTGGPNWIYEGWGYRSLQWLKDRFPTKPFLVQEFGSYSVNAKEGSNLMFILVEAAVQKFSTCAFAFATNDDGWKGTSTDRYTISNVDVTLKGTDKDGADVDPSLLGSVETVSESVDKVRLTSDESFDGSSVTVTGIATVTWANDGNPITKQLTAVGTGKLSADPSAGDELEMVVTVEDVPAA